jgi:hypothetical protein
MRFVCVCVCVVTHYLMVEYIDMLRASEQLNTTETGYIYLRTFINTHTQTHLRRRTQTWLMRVCSSKRLILDMYTHIHTYIHTHIHTHTPQTEYADMVNAGVQLKTTDPGYVYPHTHIHTHTHTHTYTSDGVRRHGQCGCAAR